MTNPDPYKQEVAKASRNPNTELNHGTLAQQVNNRGTSAARKKREIEKEVRKREGDRDKTETNSKEREKRERSTSARAQARKRESKSMEMNGERKSKSEGVRNSIQIDTPSSFRAQIDTENGCSGK